MPQETLGIIETKGLIAAIDAADIIAKSSIIEFIGKVTTGENFVTLLIKGELPDVQTAIEAASAIVQQNGELIASYIIPCPYGEIEDILFGGSEVLWDSYSSIGLIETNGLTGAIAAADAMLKTAKIRIVNVEHIPGAPVVVKITGETEHVSAALEAGSDISRNIKQFVKTRIIKQPDEKIEFLFPNPGEKRFTELTPQREISKKILPQKNTVKTTAKIKVPVNKKKSSVAIIETVPSEKDENLTKKTSEKSSHDNGQHDLFSTGISTGSKSIPDDIGNGNLESDSQVSIEENSRKGYSVEPGQLISEDLEKLSVAKLRRLARDMEEFPIKGRVISMANKTTLLEYFKQVRTQA